MADPAVDAASGAADRQGEGTGGGEGGGGVEGGETERHGKEGKRLGDDRIKTGLVIALQ